MSDTKRLKKILNEGSRFALVVELTGGPGYNFDPIGKFLKAYQENQGQDIPESFALTGIMLPQNPGGIANIDPSDVIALIEKSQLSGDLDIIPHISCKDCNTDSLTSSLVGYRQRGIETILALTGDKPVTAQGVFEVESVGLLSMIKRMNQDSILETKPGQWDKVHR